MIDSLVPGRILGPGQQSPLIQIEGKLFGRATWPSKSEADLKEAEEEHVLIRGVNASNLNGQTLSNLTGARHADVKNRAFYNRCVGVKYVSSQLLRGVARAGGR